MSGDFSEMLTALVDAWRTSGAAIRPGNTMAAITDFKRAHGVSLPPDVVGYFLRADGMEEGSWDEHMIRFWPLGEIKAVADEIGKPSEAYDGFFVFADYSVWAHAYAIRLREPERNEVVVVGGDSPIRVASSFADFIRRYLNEPMGLFPGDGDLSGVPEPA